MTSACEDEIGNVKLGFHCPYCHNAISTDVNFARTGFCEKCGAVFSIGKESITMTRIQVMKVPLPELIKAAVKRKLKKSDFHI